MPLPPPPIKDIPSFPYSIQQWFNQIRSYVGASVGSIPWATVSKTGAHLSDIPDRPHSQLTSVSGNGAYHLSVTERDYAIGSYTTLPSGITPGASPYTYHNTAAYDADVAVQGGTVTKLEFSRDNLTFYDIGVTAGLVRLSPGDYLKVTHAGAPTMTLIPR